jgi:hypothetical protein
MELSEKNTKAEILKAYDKLLKDVQIAKTEVPKKMQEEKQKTETLNKVANLSNEGIVKSIVTLKSGLNSSLEEIQQSLMNEFKKLEEIRAAIALEKQSLEDLYSLSANTDSLAAMLLAQKEKKENFEKAMTEKTEAFAQEMTSKKEQWEIEKSKQKTAEKEYTDELNKRRKRDEDEYAYNLKVGRQKEKDDYDTKKTQLEKELIDKKERFELDVTSRELNLKNAESELAELRKANAEFPGKLERALKDKEAEVTKLLQTKYGFDIQLKEKQYESDIRLKDQMISSLQEKIKEQQDQLKDYAEKSNLAEANVKDIAVKAIENASKVRMITAKSEKDE